MSLRKLKEGEGNSEGCHEDQRRRILRTREESTETSATVDQVTWGLKRAAPGRLYEGDSEATTSQSFRHCNLSFTGMRTKKQQRIALPWGMF